MKNYNITYEEIIEDIEKEHQRNSDQLVLPKELNAWPNKDDITKYFTYKHDQDFEFTYSAMDQILSRLGIPARFYRKNPAILQVAMFNYWNGGRDTPYLFRLKDKNLVRAVLTEKYGVMDDIEVFPTVIKELYSYETTPRWLNRDNQITQLAVHFNDVQTNFENNNYRAGMVITNSETGHSSVWIEPVVYMSHYTFYHRATLQRQKVNLRLVHRGTVDIDRIKPMIEQAKEIAQVGIVQLIEVSQEVVGNNQLVNFVNSIDALTKRLKDRLIEEWEEEAQINKLNAARRILECATELPLFQRMTVEQQVGRLTGLFTGYKSRMQGIMQELEELED